MFIIYWANIVRVVNHVQVKKGAVEAISLLKLEERLTTTCLVEFSTSLRIDLLPICLLKLLTSKCSLIYWVNIVGVVNHVQVKKGAVETIS